MIPTRCRPPDDTPRLATKFLMATIHPLWTTERSIVCEIRAGWPKIWKQILKSVLGTCAPSKQLQRPAVGIDGLRERVTTYSLGQCKLLQVHVPGQYECLLPRGVKPQTSKSITNHDQRIILYRGPSQRTTPPSSEELHRLINLNSTQRYSMYIHKIQDVRSIHNCAF